MIMHTPSIEELLRVWEYGSGQGLLKGALHLLAAAYPEASPDLLAALSIGQRDEGLLALRERLFGPRLTGIVACVACGERLELSLDTDELQSAGGKTVGEVSVSAAGYDVRFRPLNSRDLMLVVERDDSAAGARVLLERCLSSVTYDGSPVDSGELPAEVSEVVARRMAEADPTADIRIVMDCPICHHQWRATFDIVAFLWTEIEAWAERVLSDVHALASAYGWHERDILALSPLRRQRYLEMVAA